MMRKLVNMMLAIVMIVFFLVLWTGDVVENSQLQRLKDDIFYSSEYRAQELSKDQILQLRKSNHPGENVGIYLLETKFGYTNLNKSIGGERWKEKKEWNLYYEITSSIWNDVSYFPIPESTSDEKLKVSYENTWMSERTYGGKRGHEGCDLIAEKNERGLYPILSMTDGTVKRKGWLEKGGYRIGIMAPHGAYFYYAHLDSYADLQEGDQVKAGDILGYMGDSGYGVEGTVGQFPVHLHLGIYIYPNGEEISVNPYWILRYIENCKVKCYTEI